MPVRGSAPPSLPHLLQVYWLRHQQPGAVVVLDRFLRVPASELPVDISWPRRHWCCCRDCRLNTGRVAQTMLPSLFALRLSSYPFAPTALMCPRRRLQPSAQHAC